jgi:hypothetical protein
VSPTYAVITALPSSHDDDVEDVVEDDGIARAPRASAATTRKGARDDVRIGLIHSILVTPRRDDARRTTFGAAFAHRRARSTPLGRTHRTR